MIKPIIDILNAKLETTGRIDKRHCLTEARERGGDGAIVPYEFTGNGELKAINTGNLSMSWWKITNPLGALEDVATTSNVSKLQGTFDLRLVVMYRRKDSTKDDGFTPSWLGNDLRRLLTFNNGDLKTALQAADVRVSVTSTDLDTTRVWNQEFENVTFTDPKYKTGLIALEISVTVIAKRECWETECTYDDDILHIFDFCKQGTVDRLTAAQQACLITALCGADATVNINGALWDTVAAGGTLEGQVHDTADNDVGTIVSTTEVEIADSSNEVNGVDISDPTLAEGTHNQQIHDSLGNAVGTAANPSVVGDSTVTINSASLGATGSIEAEGSQNIVVWLDGSPSGSWNGSQWAVTSAVTPAPSVSVGVNDSSPQWGDTITITATPSNITPTNYLAFNICALNAMTYIGEQAGAVFNWKVETPSLGTNDIYVTADDGTDSCFNVGGETITVLGLLLDVYTGADRAYSTRLIRYNYTGALVLLRRSSDNAQLAFYPDSNNELSMSSEDGAGTDLSTWVGANSAYVVTWYDQEGSTDVTQGVAGSQVLAVNAGTLVTSNGKAGFDADGIADYANTGTNVAYSGGVSWYCVIDLHSVAANKRIWGDDNTGAQGYSVFFADGTYQVNDNSTGFKAINQTGITTGQRILSCNIDDSNGNYNNGVDGALTSGTIASWTGPINTGATPNFGLMGAGNGAQYGDGVIQELVIFPNDQSANRTGIETDQNSHFSVY
jgi:hypothetical protein